MSYNKIRKKLRTYCTLRSRFGLREEDCETILLPISNLLTIC